MFEELEYKYRANHVEKQAFKVLMASLPVKRVQTVASWDIYYVQKDSETSFQRFRNDSSRPELTKKIKTTEGNNWVRVESDLPLDPARVTEEIVAFHVGLDGYKENFRIFKYCEIYFLQDLNYVFYIVYNQNMTEVGRFIEVEVNKNSVFELELEKQGRSLEVLKEGEQHLLNLGISPQNRLKKSLFELYRREA